MAFHASTFGLDGWLAKLVLIAITLAAAGVAFATLRWLVPKIVSRVRPGADPRKSRQRHSWSHALCNSKANEPFPWRMTRT